MKRIRECSSFPYFVNFMKYDISHIMLCFMRVAGPPLSSSKPPANLRRSETGQVTGLLHVLAVPEPMTTKRRQRRSCFPYLYDAS